jgi:hypothetical protein
MSDTNLVDKISEAFSNTIKKTNIFEKFVEIKRMCSSLFIFTTITGVTLLFYQAYNSASLESIDIRSHSIENRVYFLDKKIDKLIETNKKLCEIIIQNNKLSNKFIENQLLYICKANNTEVEIFNNEVNESKEDDTIQNSTSYEELLKEVEKKKSKIKKDK